LSIIFAPEAEADLRELLNWVADRNPRAAVELEERIFDIIERLAVREMEGPEQRLRTGQIVKSWPVPPVRVYYQRTPDVLEIVRVYHQSRRPITR
jgi:plasmid stabilization system protein ParE